MTKKELIDYGNRSISGIWSTTSEETIKYLSEFCLMRNSKKGPLIIQAYPQLPEQIKKQLIQAMIDIYCDELEVNKLCKIIKTPFGDQFQIIKYL